MFLLTSPSNCAGFSIAVLQNVFAAENCRFYKSFQYALFKSTQTGSFDTSTRTKSIIISRDFKNLLVLLWRLLQPCPFQSVPPSSRRTTSSTCVPAKDVKNVTWLIRLTYTAIVPQSGGASLSPMGMFSASITCSSCGIICEQALNRINERNLNENSPEIRSSGGCRIARTAGAAAAAERMTTKEGRRRAFSWSSEALGLG